MPATTLCKQNIEIVQTRTIFLKEGQLSREVVLLDPTGNMYFSVCLKYISSETVGQTHIEIIDDYHARFTIETRPQAQTGLDAPFQIGSYLGRKLFFDFVVMPQGADGLHNTTLTFYAE